MKYLGQWGGPGPDQAIQHGHAQKQKNCEIPHIPQGKRMFLKQPTEDLVQKRLSPPSGLYNMAIGKANTVKDRFYRYINSNSSKLKDDGQQQYDIPPPRQGGIYKMEMRKQKYVNDVCDSGGVGYMYNVKQSDIHTNVN